MHECSPEHWCVGTVILKHNEDTEEEGMQIRVIMGKWARNQKVYIIGIAMGRAYSLPGVATL